MSMIPRLLLCMVLGCLMAACSTPPKKKTADSKTPPQPPTMEDMSEDVDFQAFVGRLRQAVAAHDMNMVASLMTTDFGYRLNPLGEGDGVFQYWDDEVLWPQLQAILSERFVPKGNFMVSPPEFASDPNYHGYRAGMTIVDGAWKFAYFVNN
ncbi:MAG: hypothetical protein ABSE62_08550 [Chthoniobacteraceae bacterium]|jgi:hypothetical protein